MSNPTRRLNALSSIMKACGIRDVRDMLNRIALQRRCYMLWICGFDLGYTFTPGYYGGPISQMLSNEMRENHDLPFPTLEETNRILLPYLIAVDNTVKGVLPEYKLPSPTWAKLICLMHYVAIESYGALPTHDERQKIIAVNALVVEKTECRWKMTALKEKILKSAWQALWGLDSISRMLTRIQWY